MQIREMIMAEMSALREKTTKQHIQDCKKALDLSDVTMHKYLAGNGSKIEVYQSILNYLRNAI